MELEIKDKKIILNNKENYSLLDISKMNKKELLDFALTSFLNKSIKNNKFNETLAFAEAMKTTPEGRELIQDILNIELKKIINEKAMEEFNEE